MFPPLGSTCYHHPPHPFSSPTPTFHLPSLASLLHFHLLNLPPPPLPTFHLPSLDSPHNLLRSFLSVHFNFYLYVHSHSLLSVYFTVHHFHHFLLLTHLSSSHLHFAILFLLILPLVFPVFPSSVFLFFSFPGLLHHLFLPHRQYKSNHRMPE